MRIERDKGPISAPRHSSPLSFPLSSLLSSRLSVSRFDCSLTLRQLGRIEQSSENRKDVFPGFHWLSQDPRIRTDRDRPAALEIHSYESLLLLLSLFLPPPHPYQPPVTFLVALSVCLGPSAAEMCAYGDAVG